MKRRKIALLGFTGFLVMSSLAFAAQAAAGTVGADTALGSLLSGLPPIKLGGGLLQGILTGIWGSVFAILSGWLKSPDPITGKIESLNFTMAWETVGIGVLVGIAAGLLHKAPSDLASWLTTTPMGMAVVSQAEQLWNLMFRHTAPMIKNGIASILKGTPPSPPAGGQPKS